MCDATIVKPDYHILSDLAVGIYVLNALSIPVRHMVSGIKADVANRVP